MISYAAYRVIHILGALLLFLSFGGTLAAAANGRNKIAAAFHGLGLVVLLVSGFGLMFRLGISHTSFPLWIWLKLAIWLALGAALTLIKRAPNLRTALWIVLPLLGTLAAYLCIYKPA